MLLDIQGLNEHSQIHDEVGLVEEKDMDKSKPNNKPVKFKYYRSDAWI